MRILKLSCTAASRLADRTARPNDCAIHRTSTDINIRELQMSQMFENAA